MTSMRSAQELTSPDPRLVPDLQRPGSWIVRIDGTDQSYIDPYDPTYLEFDYVQRVASIIDTTWPLGERITALHIGGAGMTLARYIAHTRPTSAQIVFEPDTTLTAAVREVVPLSKNSGIKVRAEDGRKGLESMRDTYANLVIIDAFIGARVPAIFASTQWFAHVKRVLRPGGTMVMNFTDHAPFEYSSRIMAGIAEHFSPIILGSEPSTLKGRRFGNFIAAGGGELNEHELARRAAGATFPYRILGGIELDRWIGRTKAFTDDDAVQSDPPFSWVPVL